ncbi:MAG TPA: NAD(P)H-dependent oxidoreductase [Bacilli bacterium]
MNVFIVYAHQEPKSFNGALKDTAVETLEALGHTVKVSDLYAMNFKAIADQHDFTELENADYFKYQTEQIHASKHDTFTSDITAELEKLKWADFVLFQFPLWWFSMPAILKGWVDRVFAMGSIYGAGIGAYDTGGLKGKKSMLSITTGGPELMYSPHGKNGDIHENILFPIHHGILYFSGMDVLPPFIAYSVARDPAKREQYIIDFKKRLLSIDTTPVIPYHPSSHYDETMQLKPEFRG